MSVVVVVGRGACLRDHRMDALGSLGRGVWVGLLAKRRDVGEIWGRRRTTYSLQGLSPTFPLRGPLVPFESFLPH